SQRRRAQSFLFEPEAFEYDAAVQSMAPAERGAYIMLLCGLWRQPEPGVVKDADSLLARLAHVSESEWAGLRLGVMTAFDTTTRPGFWVQRRMTKTIEAQNKRFKRLSEQGRLGGK